MHNLRVSPASILHIPESLRRINSDFSLLEMKNGQCWESCGDILYKFTVSARRLCFELEGKGTNQEPDCTIKVIHIKSVCKICEVSTSTITSQAQYIRDELWHMKTTRIMQMMWCAPASPTCPDSLHWNFAAWMFCMWLRASSSSSSAWCIWLAKRDGKDSASWLWNQLVLLQFSVLLPRPYAT